MFDPEQEIVIGTSELWEELSKYQSEPDPECTCEFEEMGDELGYVRISSRCPVCALEESDV